MGTPPPEIRPHGQHRRSLTGVVGARAQGRQDSGDFFGADPMLPAPYRIHKRRQELSDTFTLELAPADGSNSVPFVPASSICCMPSAPGSACQHQWQSGRSGGPGAYHSGGGSGDGGSVGFEERRYARRARPIRHGLAGGGGGRQRCGDRRRRHRPGAVAAGHLLRSQPAEKYGDVCIYYGARTPEDILYRAELEKWRGQFDLTVDVTVDRAIGKWAGKVGVVTRLMARGGFDPSQTVALVCGPEIMMRYAIKSLNQHGVANNRIYVSMERNMKCAIGFCGHCQLGPYFICKDGPVFRFDRIESLFEIREL